MQNFKYKFKTNFLLIILLISLFTINPINQRNSIDAIDVELPKDSNYYNINTTYYASDVYVCGNYAYVSNHYAGLAIIDISDPTTPGTPVYMDTLGTARNVYVSGNYDYVAAGNGGLNIIDITDPTSPGTPISKTTDYTSDVYIEGNYAYIAENFDGLSIIDVSDPTNPGEPFFEDTTGYGRSIYVSGNYAYLAAHDQGLDIIDISENIDPTTAIYEDTVQAHGVYVDGDYAFIADHSGGLATIDISDPTNPGTPAVESTTGNGFDVFVAGDYAYMAISDQGLAVIDISDPTNPGTPVVQGTTSYALGVYVSGDYAYVAVADDGLAIIDISNPLSPGTPVYEDTADWASDVYVSGDYAYVADGASGLAVIDISDPTNPGTPIYEDTAGNTQDIIVSGDYAYIADYTAGLAVIDISNPTNPGTPVYEDTNYHAYGIFISGDTAYIADSNSGLAIIDISNPSNPGTPIYEDTAISARDVVVSGDYAYVADNSAGLAIIQVRQRYHLIAPEITIFQSDFSVEYGYTGQSISWTAIDTNPDIYTIDLFGTGIVAGPTAWTSGNPIVYNIPDGLSVGDHEYFINFTDSHGNYIIDNFTFTVEDTTNPVITATPSIAMLEEGYTGQSISWTATDPHPNTYTIELQGSGVVAGPTAWTSGNPIVYNIPDGFSSGDYNYTVNFQDDHGNNVLDNITFTVDAEADPTLNYFPPDLIVEYGYTGQSLTWTATDVSPNSYTIELQGSGVVAGPIAWTSGNPIVYDIPDGFSLGDHIYIVNFTDLYGNFITDSATFTVEDTIKPIIIFSSNNITIEVGYSNMNISWIATDIFPGTYTIELVGSGISAGPLTWSSGDPIYYMLPDSLASGV